MFARPSAAPSSPHPRAPTAIRWVGARRVGMRPFGAAQAAGGQHGEGGRLSLRRKRSRLAPGPRLPPPAFLPGAERRPARRDTSGSRQSPGRRRGCPSGPGRACGYGPQGFFWARREPGRVGGTGAAAVDQGISQVRRSADRSFSYQYPFA